LETPHANTNETWYDVWQRKGARAAGKPSYAIEDLFAADGFDGAMARTDAQAHTHIRQLISSALQLTPATHLLEVGCGAGAVLSLLADTGATLAGADFSAAHIEIARRVLPTADLRVAEAAALPWPDATFDAVFSYGVFLYFQDLAYAAAVLGEMLRVARPGARILILDIPDAARREECEAARRAAGASLNPPHCYYPKSFFEDYAAAHRLTAAVFDQQVPGYTNSRFRFNALLTPPPALPPPAL